MGALKLLEFRSIGSAGGPEPERKQKPGLLAPLQPRPHAVTAIYSRVPSHLHAMTVIRPAARFHSACAAAAAAIAVTASNATTRDAPACAAAQADMTD
jgi:hypothetical protein